MSHYIKGKMGHWKTLTDTIISHYIRGKWEFILWSDFTLSLDDHDCTNYTKIGGGMLSGGHGQVQSMISYNFNGKNSQGNYMISQSGHLF